MTKTLISPFVLILCSPLFAQIETSLIDEDFNGFISDEINITYSASEPYDSALYKWRPMPSLDLENNPPCSWNGSTIMVAGNYEFPFITGEFNTEMIFPEVDASGFDSLKLQFDYVYVGGTLSVDFSLNQGQDWTQAYVNSLGGNNLCEPITADLDVTGFGFDNLTMRFNHEYFHYSAVDNIKLLGYTAETIEPCDTVYIELPPDTVFITVHDTIIIHDTIFVTGINKPDFDKERSLIKVTDIRGREVDRNTSGQTLLFIYDDGTIEKRIQILKD